MEIINSIHSRAKKKGAHIVLPEATDFKVLRAAEYLHSHNICRVTLIGGKKEILDVANKHNITLSGEIIVVEEENIPRREALCNHLVERLKHKGITHDHASRLLEDPLYLAGSMVATHRVDGCVAGSLAPTGEVIKAAISTIGLKDSTSIVSSIFLMALDNKRVLTYADCGVVPYPDSSQLSEIAIESSATHQLLTGQSPVIALLSFSTKGSAEHDRIDIVRKAVELVKEKRPDLPVDGELQFDAAFVPEIGDRKAPGSTVAGNANVYIFPNLDAGNIAYKITERLGGATATGPILQGLNRPMIDLSRGCNWEDIVNACCVAILMGESSKTN